ncbi:hypothetical protein ELQ39_16570 [Streptomyces sp. GB4-14]|nr:hypothetical protein [Streptomyces sp. GB4-14]
MVQGVQVERATVRTTWTPWAASARLCLGRRWSGWEPPPDTPLRACRRPRCPLHPGAGRSPAGGIICDRRARCAVLASWPPAQPTSGRASAQRGRSGPKAGAAPGAEPGSAPGGAERSRGLMR